MLVLELWGLGDLALAMSFLRAASGQMRVTLLAKPHAAPLLARFAPAVELLPLIAPWTAFTGKYRLGRWPWATLFRVRRELRAHRFDVGVSARPDPRDHAVLALAGCRRRVGFSRLGSRALLTDALSPPAKPHRIEHWRAIAAHLGWPLADLPARNGTHATGTTRRIVIHAGAAQPARRWPLIRFQDLAARLRHRGWDALLLDDTRITLDELLDTLSAANGFIGNCSGPGHLAAILGVPTFTVFGPSLPALFSPVHPQAEWIEGAPCPYRPCSDQCRFAAPRCIESLSTDEVWARLQPWLSRV
jgi:heptosyltransferase-2